MNPAAHVIDLVKASIHSTLCTAHFSEDMHLGLNGQDAGRLILVSFIRAAGHERQKEVELSMENRQKEGADGTVLKRIEDRSPQRSHRTFPRSERPRPFTVVRYSSGTEWPESNIAICF